MRNQPNHNNGAVGVKPSMSGRYRFGFCQLQILCKRDFMAHSRAGGDSSGLRLCGKTNPGADEYRQYQ
jgi:hypothetical protein